MSKPQSTLADIPHTSPSEKEEFSLTENIHRYKFLLFTTYRTHFLIFCLSALADALSTQYFMSLVGPRAESNFLVRILSYYYGITAGPILGKAFQVFALWGFSILTPRLTRFICLIIIAINFSAAIVNFASFGPADRHLPPPQRIIVVPTR